MGPTWGPRGADRTHVGPMLAPWTLLSGVIMTIYWLGKLPFVWIAWNSKEWRCRLCKLTCQISNYSEGLNCSTSITNDRILWMQVLLSPLLIIHPFCISSPVAAVRVAHVPAGMLGFMKVAPTPGLKRSHVQLQSKAVNILPWVVLYINGSLDHHNFYSNPSLGRCET